MKAVFTGGSSPLGAAVLGKMLASASFDEVACTVHKRAIPLQSPKLRPFALDLATLDQAAPEAELLVHFASLTHARNPVDYMRVNFEGSLRLIDGMRERGCRRILLVSTRCVGPEHPRRSCGAYAESKRALEHSLLEKNWDSLVIVRPAEVYGGGGAEGIDQFIRLARTFRLAPLIFGDPRIRFAPLHHADFVGILSRLLDAMPNGVHVYELCGPEALDGPALARALSRAFGALPIPVWWPLVAVTLRALSGVGVRPIAPDQIDRLIGDKSSEKTSEALLSFQAELTTFQSGLSAYTPA